MREILFRGKPLGKLDEDFIYGSLGVIDTDLVAIYQCKLFTEDIMALVDIGTVGQYTGLTDKNGKRIFEGDILSVTVRETIKECGARKFTGNTIKTVWAVEYAERRSQGNGFYVFGKDRRFSLGLTKSVIFNANPEVIGNIHDNPELLKGGAE